VPDFHVTQNYVPIPCADFHQNRNKYDKYVYNFTTATQYSKAFTYLAAIRLVLKRRISPKPVEKCRVQSPSPAARGSHCTVTTLRLARQLSLKIRVRNFINSTSPLVAETRARTGTQLHTKPALYFVRNAYNYSNYCRTILECLPIVQHILSRT